MHYIAVGVDAVEVDAARTSFGYVGVWHLRSEESFSTNPLWISYRRVHELLRSAKIDGVLEGLHTLKELLAEAKGLRGVMIDVKDVGIYDGVAEAVKESGFTGSIYLSLKSLDEVDDYRALIPEALIFGSVDKGASIATSVMRAYGLNGLSVKHDLINEELINSVHDLGGLIASWVVNSRKEAQLLAKLGVNLIISDMPEELSSLRTRNS